MPLNNKTNDNINNHYSTYPSANQFEITNPSRVLSTPIKTALQAASSKSSIPVLEGILFELTGEGLVLVGSDLEQWIIVRVPEIKLPLGLTNDPIKFVLPKKVAEAILRLPDGLAVFEFLPERVALKINYGNGIGRELKNSQTHQLYRADDFIQVPEVQGEEFPFNSSVGVDLKRVAFAAAGPNEPRIVFQGINVNFEARKIAANDTTRMAVMDIPREECKGGKGINIPDETAKIAPRINIPARMVKAIDSLDEPTLTVNSNLIKAVSGNKDSKNTTTIVSRLIHGEYPKLSPIVESAVNSKIFEVEFSAREMIGTLNRVGLMVSGNQMPRFVFRADSANGGNGGNGVMDGYITVSTQSESGMVAEDIYFELVDGKPENVNLECLFNARFIMDALKHAESEKVTWGLTGQYTPSVIRAAGDDKDKGKGGKDNSGGDNWLCIIVPGRMGGE